MMQLATLGRAPNYTDHSWSGKRIERLEPGQIGEPNPSEVVKDLFLSLAKILNRGSFREKLQYIINHCLK